MKGSRPSGVGMLLRALDHVGCHWDFQAILPVQ
jgi:hypothetical protein